MGTLRDLVKLVEEKEGELAYGSETVIKSKFVREYDTVGSILSGDSDLDPNMDVTEAYDEYLADYAHEEGIA